MKKLTRTVIQILIFVPLFIMGCNVSNGIESVNEEVISEDPYIVGVITEIKEFENFKQFLVEEDPAVEEPSEPGGKKTWFGTSEKTEVFVKQEDGTLIKTSPKSIKVDQQIQGWTDAVILLSHPTKTEARRIVILED